MTTFKELPPRTTGNATADLTNIRDYLIRMNKSLQTALQSIETSGRVSGTSISSNAATTAATAEAIEQNKKELKALITKTAHTLEQYTDTVAQELNSTLVARSEFGNYLAANRAYIEATATGVVESYQFEERIETVESGLSAYETLLNGEIRRGIVLDPTTQTYVAGIAISQNLVTGAACPPEDPNNPGDGNTYYYLSAGQTFGLYTSTGWQFWVDGYKKGWYNSMDGMLHIENVYIENTLQIGAKAQFLARPGSVFGIKMITE